MQDVAKMTREELFALKSQTEYGTEQMGEINRELLSRAPQSWGLETVDTVYEIEVCDNEEYSMSLPEPFLCSKDRSVLEDLVQGISEQFGVAELLERRTYFDPYMGDVNVQKDKERVFHALFVEGEDETEQAVQNMYDAFEARWESLI